MPKKKGFHAKTPSRKEERTLGAERQPNSWNGACGAGSYFFLLCGLASLREIFRRSNGAARSAWQSTLGLRHGAGGVGFGDAGDRASGDEHVALGRQHVRAAARHLAIFEVFGRDASVRCGAFEVGGGSIEISDDGVPTGGHGVSSDVVARLAHFPWIWHLASDV
jgi:hypothetical protein